MWICIDGWDRTAMWGWEPVQTSKIVVNAAVGNVILNPAYQWASREKILTYSITYSILKGKEN